MNAAPKQYFFSPSSAGARRTDGIEWEELPSLGHRLTTRGGWRHSEASNSDFSTTTGQPVWDATMPAALDSPPPPSEPLREQLEGLATREVHEPGVFDHFFRSHDD